MVCPLKNSPPPGQLIYHHDDHAIYEIDGESHQLFAQNLSLFAKLFLDNKSVFFDVGSFNYYLLVAHIPPTSTSNPAKSSNKNKSKKASSNASVPPAPTNNPEDAKEDDPDAPPHPRQIIGFFSKEKLSWDNNNLACILIFPPWQRKGLGRILMGVSYELSRREGRYGGPEKPLSELGRKGYLQFWQVTVAREVLGSSGLSIAGYGRGRRGPRASGSKIGRNRLTKGAGPQAPGGIRKKTTIPLNDLARRCWLLPEDCLAALTTMGAIAGTDALLPVLGAKKTVAGGLSVKENADSILTSPSTTQKRRKDGKVPLDKASVRGWAQRTRIDLRAPVDLEGFCGGWEEGEDEEDGEEDGEGDGGGRQVEDEGEDE